MDNYTKRCLYAILQHEKSFVRWPDAAERGQTKARIRAHSFFKECVGFIDGTLITFAAAPQKHKEDYWTRKSVYALNSLLICDDQRRVIYAHHGWCGSAHDQRVLKSSLVRLSSLTKLGFDRLQPNSSVSSGHTSVLFQDGFVVLTWRIYLSRFWLFIPRTHRSHIQTVQLVSSHPCKNPLQQCNSKHPNRL